MILSIIATIDPLWAIIILIISALSSWLQKRQQRKKRGDVPGQAPEGDWSGQANSPAAGSEKSAAENWEAELKRLLSGETTEAPPPVVMHPQAPPPIPVPPPLVVIRQPAPRAPVVVESRPTMETMVSRSPTEEQELVVTPPSFLESRSAYSNASQLDEAMAARIEQVTHHSVAMTHAVLRRERSVEAYDAVAMLRNPRTARQAFIVSQIFGPPRALEPLTW